MKNVVVLGLLLLLLGFSGPARATPEEKPQLMLGSRILDLEKEGWCLLEGTWVAPLRNLAGRDQVQVKVHWDQKQQKAFALDQGNRMLIFTPGESHVEVLEQNGLISRVGLPGPVRVIEGQLMVPARAFFELLEFYVTWYGEENLIKIKDLHPAWRKLLSLEKWQESVAQWHHEIFLKEGCLPCTRS